MILLKYSLIIIKRKEVIIMKKYSSFRLLFLVSLFTVLMTSMAFAGRQDFILVNETGETIYDIYVMPSNDHFHRSDVLETDMLYDGYSVNAFFDNSTKYRFWDIMAYYGDNTFDYWYNIDLYVVSAVILLPDGNIRTR